MKLRGALAFVTPDIRRDNDMFLFPSPVSIAVLKGVGEQRGNFRAYQKLLTSPDDDACNGLRFLDGTY